MKNKSIIKMVILFSKEMVSEKILKFYVLYITYVYILSICIFSLIFLSPYIYLSYF